MEENNNNNPIENNNINEVRPDATIEPYTPTPTVTPEVVSSVQNEEIINPVLNEESVNPQPSVAPVNQLPPLPEIGSASPLPEEPKKSKAPIIIVIVLLLVVIAIVLYFVLSKKQNNTDNPTENTNQTTENTNQTTENTNQTTENNNVTPVSKDKLSIIVGGHVGSGKVEVVSTISKTFGKEVSVTDVENGIEKTDNNVVYNVTNVEAKTSNRSYDLVYPTQHANFVKMILLYGNEYDGAIITVSGSEGLMPQTREHIKMLNDVGVSKIVVFLDTTGVTDNELTELVEMEIRELMIEYKFDGDNAPIIKGNATDQNAIKELMSAADTYFTKVDNSIKEESKTKFKAAMYLLTKEEGGRHTPIFSNYKPQFVFDKTNVDGTLTIDDGTEMAMPGDNLDCIVELTSATTMKKGTKFIIREDGKTVGVGIVTEVLD